MDDCEPCRYKNLEEAIRRQTGEVEAGARRHSATRWRQFGAEENKMHVGYARHSGIWQVTDYIEPTTFAAIVCPS